MGPWDLGTPGPWNPRTLGLLDLFPPPTPPHNSPYILIPPPISASYSPTLVWFGYGGVVKFDNEIGDGPLTFILIPWDLWTLRLSFFLPLSSSTTSSYFFLDPLISTYLFLLLSSFGMVWLGGGEVATLENENKMDL